MTNQEDLKHVCDRCSKKFRCGKSLGGHMRSHVMADKAQIKKSKEVVKHEEKQDDNSVKLSRKTPKEQEKDEIVAMEVLSSIKNGDGFSSVYPEIDEEMTEAARSLMELSRDSFNLVAESLNSNGLQNKPATTENSNIKIIINRNLKKGKVYICPFCSKDFKSGQALGGHKRIHSMGGGNVGTIDNEIEREETPQLQELQPQLQPQTPSLQQPPQQQRRRPLLVDLNLPCIMEE